MLMLPALLQAIEIQDMRPHSQQKTNQKPVVIAGAGIGGLSLALTLQQLDVPCLILESVSELKPLGVGINLQPNAVRELFEMGITAEQLDKVGVRTQEWALVGRNGREIYAEPRGVAAGYNWPQYSVHRGQLQMLLHDTLISRGGADSLKLGFKVVSYTNHTEGVSVIAESKSGERLEIEASLLVGADGLHSNVRAQMYPNQPEPHWSGAIMWRGVTMGKTLRTDASFIGLGHHDHRLVVYPISQPDENGLSVMNWIAEITVDTKQGLPTGDWNRKVELEDFLEHFADWDFDWLDVPAMLKGAGDIYEYPMIDRDPVPSWVEGRVVLMGDAAHVMYPVGSNGASQAIVDARELGAAFIAHGVGVEAINAYDQKMCGPISALVLRNRGSGPFGLLREVDERCGGDFEEISDVISQQEMDEFMHNYKSAAGFAMEALNAAPSIIPEGAKV